MNPTAKLKNQSDNSRMTPLEVIERAHATMTTIDLDPASDAEANARVRASEIYTIAENGLNQAWFGNVFLNPPGGKLRLYIEGGVTDASKAALWWAKLLHEVRYGNTKQAIFVCFNLEAMLNTQKWAPLPIQAFPYCVPHGRLKYKSRNGGNTNSPAGASAIVYVGENVSKFRETFADMGYCTHGLSRSMFRSEYVG